MSVTYVIGFLQNNAMGPYIVCSADQFMLVGTDLNASYVLYSDITLASLVFIGTACGGANPFNGDFDGRGRTIFQLWSYPDYTLFHGFKFISLQYRCAKILTLQLTSLTDAEVCGQIDNTMLSVRENSSTGPYIVCSRSHLEAIDNAASGAPHR